MARKGYKSLEPNNRDEHAATESDDEFHNGHTSKLIEARDDAADTPLSSDDEYTLEDEANVKLLPIKADDGSKSKSRRPRRNSATRNRRISSSDSDDGAANDDPHVVGERIEQLLQKDQRERNALSESFNLDLEDGDSLLALSDEDNELYGFPADKRPYTDDENSGNATFRSKIQAVVHKRPWWQICALLAIGLVVMWLSAVGLRRSFNKKVVAEFVRPSVLILTGLDCGNAD